MSEREPSAGRSEESSGAREEILARIRVANEAAGIPTPASGFALHPGNPPSAGETFPGEPPVSPAKGGVRADLVDRFVDRLLDYKATVQQVTPEDLPRVVAEVLYAADARSVIAPDGLPPGLFAAYDGLVGTGEGLSAHELDEVAATVTTSALGIAETGTIVLDHGPGQGRRALTLVPDLHVCLVDVADLVPDVPDAVAALRARVEAPARPLTWVSGPSATSDIELERVEGVHGPRRLVVLLVSGHEPDPA